MTGVDLSNKGLRAAGAITVAAWISHRDKGALVVLSLKGNRLATKEGGKVLAQALASNSTLKELDVSSNNWYNGSAHYGRGQWTGDGSGFAQELALGIKDNGALIKLKISSNNIGGEQEGELQRICVASGIELAK
jgi:hypothetical protein